MGRGKSPQSLALIDACYAILKAIQPATVRAVCYRLFVAGLMPSMAKTCTNRVSSQLTYAREQGIIPWAWVVDETREAERVPAWTDPEAYIKVVERSYRRDRWAQQPYLVEVWAEKGTVRGTLAPVLDQYGVTFRVMHGYASATAIHAVVEEHNARKKPVMVFYAGDWDPSGLHMSQVDIPQRLEQYGAEMTRFERTALTSVHINDASLPSFDVETKRNDTRHHWFKSRYGARCWELDALNPVDLRRTVEMRIRAYIDWESWNRCGLAEEAEKATFVTLLGNWRSAISGQATI
jgi:hypothetical protein